MITQEEALYYFEYQNGKVYWKVGKKGARKKQEAGTLTPLGYRQVMCNGVFILVHRLVYLMHHGYLPKEIDHINGKRDDNRIENLRATTRSQNMWNRKLNKNNTSGIKGVTKLKDKWAARVCTNSKLKHIGVFDTIEEAKKAVEEYRTEHHKEYARHE